jgi:hypothetical protein
MRYKMRYLKWKEENRVRFSNLGFVVMRVRSMNAYDSPGRSRECLAVFKDV